MNMKELTLEEKAEILLKLHKICLLFVNLPEKSLWQQANALRTRIEETLPAETAEGIEQGAYQTYQP